MAKAGRSRSPRNLFRTSGLTGCKKNRMGLVFQPCASPRQQSASQNAGGAHPRCLAFLRSPCCRFPLPATSSSTFQTTVPAFAKVAAPTISSAQQSFRTRRPWSFRLGCRFGPTRWRSRSRQRRPLQHTDPGLRHSPDPFDIFAAISRSLKPNLIGEFYEFPEFFDAALHGDRVPGIGPWR